MENTLKIGPIPVILLCAAFVMIPLVVAAGPGQGTNQGNDQIQAWLSQGPPQGGPMNQGGGQRGPMMPNYGQNSNTGTTQNTGNSNAPGGPQGGGLGNMNGNMTMPGPGEGNMTAFGNMTWHGQDRMTADNMTYYNPPFDSNMTTPGNWTAPGNMTMPQPGQGMPNILGTNLTSPDPATGNMTPPQVPDNGNSNGQNAGPGTSSVQQQGNSGIQAQSQDQKDSNLIAEFLTWLRGQSGSSS
ncbi:hypothetical protein [Methanoregula sp.]|uniref:hypothetical protein n=1 Tax=Methanoregula sp. TaxID=2052170 RepID=UPI003C2785CC